ncbi:hypothetical protein AAC03nite_38700 [Alicyclobacillus acidoterrestris]|nr:hypothetical protein AAC03nite_38700 [Alicyclobacillus acidoterrestris]
MTVSLYVGPVGSGKSYCALVEGLEVCRNPHRGVVSNVPVGSWSRYDKRRGSDKRWFTYSDDEITPGLLIRLAVQNGWVGREGSAKLIIDEAAVKFNSRDWQKSDRPAWIRFLNHSRKLGYDVILITQSRNMLDKQIREACEFVVKHVNLKRYKWLAWLPVRVFMQVSYWQQGNFRGTARTRVFSRRVARRYDTFAVFDKELQDALAEVAEGESVSPPVADSATAPQPVDESLSVKSCGTQPVGGDLTDTAQ